MDLKVMARAVVREQPEFLMDDEDQPTTFRLVDQAVWACAEEVAQMFLSMMEEKKDRLPHSVMGDQPCDWGRK